MQVAVFGLGKMGAQIARRLHKNGFNVLAWNRSPNPREEVAKAGVKTYGDIAEVVGQMSETPRIFWVMVLQEAVDGFLEQLMPHVRAGDIIIDGGNSFYKDTIRRSKSMEEKGIIFYDSGTSGGVWGEANGFAMMIGGPKEHWSVVDPIFKALSSGTNYGLVGSHGAGHFVKMVHNGIEYGMMEAIGEGYAVMQASPLGLDLKEVTKIYQQGTVIRSWLIDLVGNIFEEDDIEATAGYIHMLGEGEWTVEAGHELGVDVRVIEDSVNVRKESKDPKNQNKFSNKIVALMRKQFGGHSVAKK